MSNAKRLKIMKKLFYSVLALAGILAVSCNKEIEQKQAPVETAESVSTHTVTIRADFGADTRTAYANDKTFSWVEGDVIYVYTVNEATSRARFAELTAQSSGATAEFVGEVEDGFEPMSLAFYAHSEWVTWDSDNFYIYLPGTTAIDDDKYSYNVSSSNPMANVPLSGLADSEGVFHFTTATGVVKFNLTDLPENAEFFELSAADGNMLSGLFAVDLENGQMNRDGAIIEWTYTDSEGQEQTERVSYSNLFYKFTPDAQGKATIYVPVPVGTLGAGATIRIYNSDDEVVFTKKTVKDIPVTRNKITELTALSCQSTWVSLGTGQYNDAQYLYDLFMEDMDVTSLDVYVDVDIQKDNTDPKSFKIVKPYEAYNTMFNYTTDQTVSAPNDMTLTILRAGDYLGDVQVQNDGLVYFERTNLGFYSSEEETEMFLYHPSVIQGLDTEDSWTHSYVMKFQSDGVTPANIQLAPMYYYSGLGCYLTDATADGIVQIVFPGCEPLDVYGVVTYDSIVDDSPAQPIACVAVDFGKDIASADVVIASSAEAAEAALAAGTNVTHVAEPSDVVNVLLPANASTGTYAVYARLNAVEGLTALVSRIIESDDFKYFNPNDDLGYTLADIVGSYSVNNYHYNPWKGNWIQGTMTFTVEESDDPFAGDIMFVNFLPETIGYFGTPTYTSNLYASFNTATGEVLIPAGQNIATCGGAEWYVGGFASVETDAKMLLLAPGSLQVEGNVAFFAWYDGAFIDGGRMNTNKDITFTRTAASGVQALAPAKGGKSVHNLGLVNPSKADVSSYAPQPLVLAK